VGLKSEGRLFLNDIKALKGTDEVSVGDTLEVLSPSGNFRKKVVVTELLNIEKEPVLDALKVQQRLYFKTDLNLKTGDILRA